MSYFYGIFTVNIADLEAVIWSFLQENAFHCKISIMVHDIPILLSWHHMFIHSGIIMSQSRFSILYSVYCDNYMPPALLISRMPHTCIMGPIIKCLEVNILSNDLTVNIIKTHPVLWPYLSWWCCLLHYFDLVTFDLASSITLTFLYTICLSVVYCETLPTLWLLWLDLAYSLTLSTLWLLWLDLVYSLTLPTLWLLWLDHACSLTLSALWPCLNSDCYDDLVYSLTLSIL